MLIVVSLLAVIYLLSGNVFLWHISEARGFEPLPWMAESAFLAIGVLIELIAHEAGHRIAGASMGWQCVRFGFGPFEFFREGRVWKRHRVKMLWGAFVRQVPPSFVHYRREKTITLLGGPASSLIFGLVFTAIAVSSPGPIAMAFFGKLGLMSFLGVLELIPRERNGIGSDGYRLWQVRRGGQALDDIQRESLAEASNFTPLRYRDWPHAVIVRLAGGDLYDTYLAYLHSLDAGNTEAASRHMGRLIAYLPEKDPNPHFAYEAAYWLALYGGDAEGARRWMKRAGQNVEPDLGRRAEAALALADRQPYLAEELAREGLAQKNRSACGSSEFELDCLRQVMTAVAASAAARR